MNEVDKIRYITRMQDKWLKEHSKLKRTIDILGYREVVVAYKYEGMSTFGSPIKYREEYLTRGTKRRLRDILVQELKEFEEKGFEKWLQEQEEEEE